MSVIARVLLALLLAPAIALAADLETTWDPVTLDDAGAALANAPDEYRIYRCGEAEPIATVAGDVLIHVEADVVTGSGTHCRAVAAYVSPFEGQRGEATVVIVVPGQPAVRVQAIP